MVVRSHPVFPLAYGDVTGMTGFEPASYGLKDRCKTILLHTHMSHTGLEPVLED